jgi:anti-sigma regulatory factor (Ser/Thr protein kinase)
VNKLSWSCVCGDNDSARGVRAEARCYLEQYADPGSSELNDAEQIVGELIANVVRHGAPPFGMCIDWREDRPTFYISDRGDARRLLYAVPDRFAENGRGLLIVRALGGQFVLDASSAERTGMRVVVQLPVCRPATVAA